MIRHALMLVAALVVAAPAAHAGGDASPPATAGDPKIPFEKYQLPNGLEVILSRDNRVPLVAVNVWYHVGSGDEVPGKSGFAHLFEHMMFQGSKNVGSDRHFEILRKIGAAEINGTTNTDRTNYYEVVPSNQLEVGLWLESDRMSHLLDVLDQGELSNQIDVVRNERRQRYDNIPYGKARFALYAALYPEGHPYRYMTIGRHEDLVAASLDDVKNFYKTWYVPANATLSIVGDFDPAVAKQLVAKWFGSFPKSEKPKVVQVPAPVVSAKEVTVTDSFAKLRQVMFAWHAPAAYATDDAELSIAANALAAEGTGRLYKSLVYDKQLAESVRAWEDGRTFSGMFLITVTLRSTADLAQVKQIVADEVARMSTQDLAHDEIARVIAANESYAFHGLERLNSRANQLQEYNQFVGDPGRLSWDLDRFRKATPASIRAAVAKYLQPAHMITVTTIPEKPAGAGAPSGHHHRRGAGRPAHATPGAATKGGAR